MISSRSCFGCPSGVASRPRRSATDRWAAAGLAIPRAASHAHARRTPLTFIPSPIPVALLAVEGEVEGKHVHARLTEESQEALLGVSLHELPHRFGRELASLGDPGNLVQSSGGADVRIEPAAGRSDEV